MLLTDSLNEQYRALLEVTESIAVHYDLAELFRDLVQRLPRVTKCSSISLGLHNSDRNTMQMHILSMWVQAPLPPAWNSPSRTFLVVGSGSINSPLFAHMWREKLASPKSCRWFAWQGSDRSAWFRSQLHADGWVRWE